MHSENSCDEIRHSCSKGTHLYEQRMAYTHHGIYLGDDFVIHYDDVVELEDFADNGWIYLKNSVKTYSDAWIVQRAKSRFGESQYHLLFNNCEYFAEWCRNGDQICCSPCFIKKEACPAGHTPRRISRAINILLQFCFFLFSPDIVW